MTPTPFQIADEIIKNLNLPDDCRFVREMVNRYTANHYDNATFRLIDGWVKDTEDADSSWLGTNPIMTHRSAVTAAILIACAETNKMIEAFEHHAPGALDPNVVGTPLGTLLDVYHGVANSLRRVKNVQEIARDEIVARFRSDAVFALQSVANLIEAEMSLHPEMELTKRLVSPAGADWVFTDTYRLMFNDLLNMLAEQGLTEANKEFAALAADYYFAREVFGSTSELYTHEQMKDAIDLVVNFQSLRRANHAVYHLGDGPKDPIADQDRRKLHQYHQTTVDLRVMKEQIKYLQESVDRIEGARMAETAVARIVKNSEA